MTDTSITDAHNEDADSIPADHDGNVAEVILDDEHPMEAHTEVHTRAASPALIGEGYVAGIDLGGTKILAAIFAPNGTIVSRSKVLTGSVGGLDVIDRMAAAVPPALPASASPRSLPWVPACPARSIRTPALSM